MILFLILELVEPIAKINNLYRHKNFKNRKEKKMGKNLCSRLLLEVHKFRLKCKCQTSNLWTWSPSYPTKFRSTYWQIYDFKLKGHDVLRGRNPYLLPPLPLCELTLKWSNFFSIGRISRLEKYVMFQHQLCLFSRKIFDFVCFPPFWPKNSNFWIFFSI